MVSVTIINDRNDSITNMSNAVEHERKIASKEINKYRICYSVQTLLCDCTNKSSQKKIKLTLLPFIC